MLHLLSIKSYSHELKDYGYNVRILDNSLIKPPNFYESFFKTNKISEVHYIDPHDFIVQKRLNTAFKKLRIMSHFYDTPGFINTKDEIDDYFLDKKKFFLTTFYQKERKN